MDRKLQLFRSLFKGREDVFATRWEIPSGSGKEAKSGYMPAYLYDPYRYRAHKMKGGTFQNYADKKYLPLTDDQLVKHLNGEQLVGLYPLLPDNTSWFIAADFDEQNWLSDSQKFIECCAAKKIPAYLERSRSGKGGHVWIFFKEPYPAIKSRKIFLSLLNESGTVSVFDKNSSFDRLFPNQDRLSGKGLGNLIALPLHKTALDQGNSCFIDPQTLLPFPDQWDFLSGIQKVGTGALDDIYHSISAEKSVAATVDQKETTDHLTIFLNDRLQLNRSAIPVPLINFLKEELNFSNSAFLIKKKIGKNTYGTERYFRLIEETERAVIIPKGFAGRLLRFCRNANIHFSFEDHRTKKASALFTFQAGLRYYQVPAMEAAAKKDMGVIVAPPGAGKTIIGLKIIAEKQQPALIVVHRKQLMDQWMDRIEAFLGIPKQKIGKIGQGKSTIGEHITVATIQSLVKELTKTEGAEIKDSFGTILIDECHHIPAESYRNTIQQFNSYYLYGFTATPFRKYNDGRLIFIHLGEIIAEITAQQTGRHKQATVIVRNTDLDVPFNSKTDRFETLSKILVHDSGRNKLILQDITNELNCGKKVVILTERKEHIDSLQQYLKQSYEVVTLSGDDTESSRTAKWKLLNTCSYQALITTAQFFGEGTDLQNANCLFLVYPFSFEGKLIQYIGRVQRSELTPVIYDYRDIKIDYLNRMFLKRNTYYRKLIRQANLFDDPVEEEVPIAEKSTLVMLDKEISVPIELLEFRYGSIAFTYSIDAAIKLEFEIQHDDMRPEFEVLKPYFTKALKSKHIKVAVYAEIEKGQLVSQLASSDDIKKIDRQIIDGVRFQFITRPLLGRINPDNKNESDQQLQTKHPLYESGKELLEDALKYAQFKHHRHLRYLADNHVGHLVKIRFVLQPFSFVFLLEGPEQFHIILETLDTEEASYLWHIPKRVSELPKSLVAIDRDLDIIRKQGRQGFLTAPPENFNRILHDYSDDQKGFILWKHALEERLV
ncbi:restriction endonuclease subunit R [Niabella ginsenosidivorans]|uniref:Restriction endonuclease subunit R n=1 Tax=Niabella ginsenosidivorans TaxID=1176587 RepID=A0A1A9I8W1_9BACT|nr:restriction endonuclease subunit R [Niabella ginsenosidivorans]